MNRLKSNVIFNDLHPLSRLYLCKADAKLEIQALYGDNSVGGTRLGGYKLYKELRDN